MHDEAFNVGATTENYRIRDVAALVEELVPGSSVELRRRMPVPTSATTASSATSSPDAVPAYQPQWTVRTGIEELVSAYAAAGLTLDDLTGPRLQRIQRVRGLLDDGSITSDLRWTADASTQLPTARG